MKLQQLKFVAAVAQSGLNVTVAARQLSATQPAVSKQIRLLEEELGLRIFVRAGRTLTRITSPGERLVAFALRALREVQNIKEMSEEFKDEDRGSLSIGTTHTQAQYVLPPVIREFRGKYPNVQLHLHQGTADQIAEMIKLGRIDVAMATGSQELFGACALLPCYQWHHRVVVPLGHPLAKVQRLSLKQLARFPILTYVFSLTGPLSLLDMFSRAGVRAHVALTARDADVIKTYVRLGMGVGIVADVALSPEEDPDLISIDVSHLFPGQMTWIGFARGGLLRRFTYDFLSLTAPHLNRRLIDQAASSKTQEEVNDLFSNVLPPRHKGAEVRGAKKTSGSARQGHAARA